MALTRRIAKDPHRRLPDPKRYTPFPAIDLAQVDPGLGRLGPLELRKAAADLETAAREAGKADSIVSVTTGCSLSSSETVTTSSPFGWSSLRSACHPGRL